MIYFFFWWIKEFINLLINLIGFNLIIFINNNNNIKIMVENIIDFV